MVNEFKNAPKGLVDYARKKSGNVEESTQSSNLESRLRMLFTEANPENPQANFTSTRGGDEIGNYEHALSHAQPDNKGLWYREVFTEKLISTKQQEEFISILREVIKTNDEKLIKKVVKTAFRFLWTKMGTGLTTKEIDEVVNSLDSFKSPFIVPVEKIGDNGIYLINETTGPTDAFKDLALQQVTTMLSVITQRKNKEAIKQAKADKYKGITYKFENDNGEEKLVKYINGELAKEQGNRPKISIVITQTSTSGDTGPAGGAGIEGRPFVANIIGFPAHEATQGQAGQMLKLKGNVVAIAFEEAFTEIQERMKGCNNDEFKKELHRILEEKFRELREEYGFDIEVSSGSFNSVNIGRIDGQSIYHSIALMVTKAQNPEITGDVIEVTPSGNFGHATGVLQANDMMGGIDDIIVSTNENDAIYRLIKDGTYQMATSEILSPSVSMIIRYGSNVERLLRRITSPERCADLMQLFATGAIITLTTEEHQKLKNLGLKTYRVETADELSTMRDVWLNHDRLICPHTANAYFAALQHRQEYPDNNKSILVSETASPWKFLASIATALTCKDKSEMASMYEELRKKESTSEGKDELLSMIKKAFEDNGKFFDEKIIPENLREIYKKGITMPKIENAKDFGELTLEFVDNIGGIFENQIRNLIEDMFPKDNR